MPFRLKPGDRLPVAGPWITDAEPAYAADAAANAWYGDAGRFNAQFEEAFADYVGRRYAISLPSCTSGLHLALAALGIGLGDEVIVPDTTWIATAAPISYLGATPVFADIDEGSWCLSAAAAEAAITSHTRAIITVDLYGGMADMAALTTLAERHGLPLIEDAAEAIGSTYGERRAGGFGLASVFSFHGSKTLTTGEGGMLVTDDEALYQRCQHLRDHGRPPGDTAFRNTEVAFKYKMSAVQAALGLAQLERVEALVERKHAIFEWYRERLGSTAGLRLNPSLDGVGNSYWMVTVLLDEALAIDAEIVMATLKAAGIDCRPFFSPLSSLPAYLDSPSAEAGRRNNPMAYRLAPRGVNLPSALILEESHVARVCDTLLRALDNLSHTDRAAS